jgi:hypothetical protein
MAPPLQQSATHAALPQPGAGLGLADAIAGLESAMASEPQDCIAASFSDALRRWPKAVKLRVMHFDWLSAAGHPDAAAAVIMPLAQGHPDPAMVQQWLVRHFLDTGRVQDAASVFAFRLRKTGDAPPRPRAELMHAILRALPDDAARLDWLDTVLDGSPEDAAILTRQAAMHFRVGRSAEARLLLERARQAGGVPSESIPLCIDVMIVEGDFTGAGRAAADLMATSPDRPDLMSKAILAARLADDQATSAELLRQAVTRWPDHPLVLSRWNRLAFDRRLDGDLFDRVRDLWVAGASERDRFTPMWKYHFALAAIRMGEVTHALAALQQVEQDDTPTANEVRRLRAMVDHALRLPQPEGRTAYGDLADPDTLVTRADARANLLVFHGMMTNFGGLPYPMLDRILAALPVNVLYLRDRSPFCFGSGRSTLGATPEETCAAIHDRLRPVAHLPLVTLGASAGGRAAVDFGLRLGARGVLSMAGQVTAAGDGPESAVARFGYKLKVLQAVGAEEFSLLPRLAAAPGMRLIHAHSRDHAFDAGVARALRALDHVEIIETEGQQHGQVFSELIEHGQFSALVMRLVDGD